MSYNLIERLSANTKGEARSMIENHLAAHRISSIDQSNFEEKKTKWVFTYTREGMNLSAIANDLAARGISVEVVGNALICAILKQ